MDFAKELPRSQEEANAYMTDVVQRVLDKPPLYSYSDFSNIVWRKLSTRKGDKRLKGLSSEDLYSLCGTLCEMLQKPLLDNGIQNEQCLSRNQDSNAHIYLVARVGKFEVLIDPSIGQFLENYNHVFIGTREQLRDLVLNQTGDRKPYKLINSKSKKNPLEMFERTWGSSSRVYGKPRFGFIA